VQKTLRAVELTYPQRIHEVRTCNEMAEIRWNFWVLQDWYLLGTGREYIN
jgi:hypothetical protein